MLRNGARLDQKSLATYLVISHESPGEDADLLVERDLVDAGGQVGAVHVDDVLEVLREAEVERLQVALALHDFQQAVELVDGQVFNDCL